MFGIICTAGVVAQHEAQASRRVGQRDLTNAASPWMLSMGTTVLGTSSCNGEDQRSREEKRINSIEARS